MEERPIVEEKVSQRVETFLTEEQIERIATRAATMAVKQMTDQAYIAVGKGVLHKILWIMGAATVGFGIWAVKQGWIEGPGL